MAYALGNINTAVLADVSVEKRTERAISEAWAAKLDQAYSKALIMFDNDPSFDPIKQLYTEKKNEIRKANRIRRVKPYLLIALVVLFLFGFVLLLKYATS